MSSSQHDFGSTIFDLHKAFDTINVTIIVIEIDFLIL